MRIVLCIASVIVLACGSTPAAPTIPHRVIGHGNLAIADAARQPGPTSEVIRDAATWNAVVQKAALRAPSFDPNDPIPPIRFGDEIAILLQLGQRPSTGYHVRVDEIRDRGPDIVVDAAEVWPCVGAAVITHPLTAISMPRTDKAIAVTWSRDPNCR